MVTDHEMRMEALRLFEENERLKKLLREATILLAKIDHTVSIHGKLDADTPLHKSIDLALEVLDPSGCALTSVEGK